MTRPTASALALAFRCQWPWTLDELPRSEPGPAARLGSAFHAIAEKVVRFGVTRNDPATPLAVKKVAAEYNLDAEQAARLAEMVNGWMNTIDPKTVAECEVPFAYDPATDTARVLTSEGPRDYAASKAGEFVGTADVVIVKDGSVEVVDWKTGQREYVEPAATNRQVRFLALCAARVYAADRVTVTLSYVDEAGEVANDSHTFDEMDIAAIAAEMAELASKLTKDAQPAVGAHCRYCPAVSLCPATQRALVEVAPPEPPATDYHMGVAIESMGHAAWLLGRLRVVREAADAVEAELKAYADAHNGIVAESGKTWSAKEISVEKIELNDEAVEALDAILPGALKASTTKAAIKKAAGKDKAKEKAALDALRAAGAVSVTTTKRYEER